MKLLFMSHLNTLGFSLVQRHYDHIQFQPFFKSRRTLGTKLSSQDFRPYSWCVGNSRRVVMLTVSFHSGMPTHIFHTFRICIVEILQIAYSSMLPCGFPANVFNGAIIITPEFPFLDTPPLGFIIQECQRLQFSLDFAGASRLDEFALKDGSPFEKPFLSVVHLPFLSNFRTNTFSINFQTGKYSIGPLPSFSSLFNQFWRDVIEVVCQSD